MNKFRTGSELAMNKFLFKPVKQIELLNLFNRGSNRLSSGLDLTDSGWGWVQTGSELAMNKFFFKLVKQIELLNLFNRGSDRLSSGLDLTDFGWLVGGG